MVGIEKLTACIFWEVSREYKSSTNNKCYGQSDVDCKDDKTLRNLLKQIFRKQRGDHVAWCNKRHGVRKGGNGIQNRKQATKILP